MTGTPVTIPAPKETRRPSILSVTITPPEDEPRTLIGDRRSSEAKCRRRPVESGAECHQDHEITGADEASVDGF
jgi:hypothetical protein